MDFLAHVNVVYECHFKDFSLFCAYSYSSTDGLATRHQEMVRQLFENEYRSEEEDGFSKFDLFYEH